MLKQRIDLPDEVVAQLNGVFASRTAIEKVLVFGSRVLGNAKPGSDVDLAIVGKDTTPGLVNAVRSYLDEETTLPYFFDCVHFESIGNKELRDHIVQFGKVLYEKER